VVVAPVLRRALLVSGGQACDAHDRSLPPFGPSGVPLPVADRMHPTAHRDTFARRRLRPCIHRDGSVRAPRVRRR